MHIDGVIYRKKWSFVNYLMLSLSMAIFSSQLYAQSAEQPVTEVETNQALPSLNCDDFSQSIRRVYTMLTENNSYDTIYQTITPKTPTVRQQILNFVVIAHTATFYNKGNDVETIVSTIDKNCGATYNHVIDKDINVQCDMYVFLINEMAKARARGVKSIDELPIRWQQPLDLSDKKSADVAKFAVEFRQDFIKPFLQEVLDSPQQSAEQFIDKFSKSCRYTVN